MQQRFYREQFEIEKIFIIRLVLLSVPASVFTVIAYAALVSDDAPVWSRVFFVIQALGGWLIVVRHFFTSLAAWNVLQMQIDHWSYDQDVARGLRLGIGNNHDDRASVVQPERVIPVRVGQSTVLRTMGGFAVQDLAHFVVRSMALGKFGTSQRNWMGERFPSGFVMTEIDEWRSMQVVFGDVGLLVNVGVERECARWVVSSPQAVLDFLRLPAVDGLSASSVAA